MSLPEYVTAADLVVTERQDGVAPCRLEVRNPTFGTCVTASPDLHTVLEWFRTPRTLESIGEEYDLPPALLDSLLRAWVLVPADAAEALRLGLLTPVSQPIGRPLRISELHEVEAAGAYAVFGAALDVVGFEGARNGPAAIRRSFPDAVRPPAADAHPYRVVDLDLRRTYPHAERLRCFDLGDVHCLGDSLESVGHRIGQVVRAARARSMCPLMLGGDHSVTWFALRAILEGVERLAVIHLDAHHDIYPVRPHRLTHGNPLRFALRDPKVERLVQVGLRTLERFDDRLDLLEDPRLVCVTAREAERSTAEEIFASVPEGAPCYLTFDIDVMAPEVAPETGTPVPGGLSFAKGLELVDHVARHLPVVGADFVEVIDRGGSNRAAAVAGRYLAQLLLGRLPYTASTSYYVRGED